MNTKLKNGDLWKDTDGNLIHAHGGHMLKHGEYIYWYGEDRTDNNYVSCYRSKDLLSWEFCAHSLTTQSKTQGVRQGTNLCIVHEDGSKVNLERPKVLYNEKTKKFVMWMHFENGRDYNDAACAVATCDTPDGEFTYHGSFRPFGQMSRDCTLFLDDDGKAYFISASRDNADLRFYLLQDDFINVSKEINVAFSNEYREAPAVIKKDGKYYLLSSYCTGWAPNQGGYSVADSLDGEWSRIEKFGDSLTYKTQPAFIITVGKDIYYVGDRWGGLDWNYSNCENFDYFKSTYYFAKLDIEGNTVKMDPAEYFEPKF